MKRGLSKSELTGLFLLAVIVIAITGCAVLIKGCGGEGSTSGEPVVIQVVGDGSSSTDEDSDSDGGNSKKGRKKGKGRAKKGKSGAKKVKSPNSVEFRDPFSDTIPLEEDD